MPRYNKRATQMCLTCRQEKPRGEMMLSSRGRLMHQCKRCHALRIKRCTTCGEVRQYSQYPNAPGSLDDGSPVLSTRCYLCQSASISAESRRKGEAAVREHTLHATIVRNMREWRRRSLAECGIKCNLTYEYVKALWKAQDGRCYYTGEPLIFGLGNGHAGQDTASLDRLTPSAGYMQGNVVWAGYWINTNKGARTYDEYLQLCCLVASRHEKGEIDGMPPPIPST